MSRTRKPKVLVKCVANTRTGPDERIIEVSFPAKDQGTGKGAPGCLIRMHNRYGAVDDRTKLPLLPRLEVYRTDGEVEVIAPRRKFWAAWCRPDGVGEASLSIHRTRTEALHWIAGLMDQQLTAADGQPMPDDELSEALDVAMNEHNAGEWDLEEVDEP